MCLKEVEIGNKIIEPLSSLCIAKKTSELSVSSVVI